MIQTATRMTKVMSLDTVFQMPVGWVEQVIDAWTDGETVATADPRAAVEAQMRKLHGSR